MLKPYIYVLLYEIQNYVSLYTKEAKYGPHMNK